MTALANKRQPLLDTWSTKEFTLAIGTRAYANGRAGFNKATGKVQPMTSAPGIRSIGRFTSTVDATSGDKIVGVRLDKELAMEWLENATAGDAVVAGDIDGPCFYLDDQTVTRTATGRSLAGRVMAVDARRGVLVEYIDQEPRWLSQPVTGAFVANDYAPTVVENGAVYDIPTTAGVSTVTLPAAALDGTLAYFAADGTKNGHTVQYRDATGPVSLTTALVASKRHLVQVVKVAGRWIANAYVAP